MSSKSSSSSGGHSKKAATPRSSTPPAPSAAVGDRGVDRSVISGIFQWIAAQDSDLADAIGHLCLEGALAPGRTSPGVTFLYPADKKYRAEIVDKAYTDEADEAARLVESLIVPDVFATAADFNRRAVGSRLGVKYAVESAAARKVVLAGGVELTPAEDFAGVDTAVWVVAKGRLPLTGDTYEAPRVERKAAAQSADGSGNAGACSSRRLLAARVESEYDECMARDGCRAYNPYLARVVGLLNFLQARHPALFALVQPLLDYEPIITFYHLLEPYGSSDDPLLPDAVLFGDDSAWNGTSAYTNAVAEYEACFGIVGQYVKQHAQHPDAKDTPYLYRNRAGVTAMIDAVRQQINAVGSNLRQIPQMVQNVYAILAAKNSIHGMGPILPEATARALSAVGPKKLWMDEMRFTMHEALQAMRGQPYSPAAFADIVEDFRTRWPGVDVAGEILLSNAADVKTDVSPRMHLLLLMKFVNSTDFLYLPVPPEMAIIGKAQAQSGGRGAAAAPGYGSMDPTDHSIYNRNAVALGGLRRVAGMVRASGLSPKAMAELRIYAHTHGGKLPGEVLALETQKT